MSTAASSTFDGSSTKDNFIPLFSGQPSEYKEWRKRILIYQHKMTLAKRASEGILNLIGSQTGTAWTLLEDFPLKDLELESTFNAVLKILDSAFQYDDRVQLPSDFEAYFMKFQRRAGQTLLAYCTEHEELIKRLDKHKVTLPTTVQGWLLLRRAGLSKEQRQLVTTQAPQLEKRKVQETLYLLFGQDYKEMAVRPHDDRRWPRHGKGRGYAAHEDDVDDGGWEDEEYEETGFYGGDDWGDILEDDASPNYEADDFDAGAAYYQEEESEDPVPFDVADYDEAFAVYTDARRRFNELKLARGYLPIVALSDPSAGNLTPGLASPSHQQLPHMKGKKGGFGFGKGKGGKSKKGKGSGTTVRYHRGPGKERDPRGPRSSANSPSKRPATSQSVESMAIGLETGMVIFQDVNGHERVDCTMLDPGASAFLCGYGPLRRYLGHLEQLGYPLEKIEFVKCCRTFHFGGDAASLSSWTVKLPVFINQKVGRIQAYLVKGETPMLLGRPIMESLGLLLYTIVMDFHGQRIKFMDGVWQSPTRGRHGEYLLSLTCDYQPGTSVNRLDFDLVVPDDDVTTANEVVNYPDFMAEETAYETFDLPRQVPESEPGDRPLRRHQLRTMEVSLQTAEKALNAEITSSLHPLTGKRVLWEIYCGGSSRVAEMAEAYGMTVERFGLDTGWDFDDPAHRAELLRRLRDEAPDEVFLAPTCGPWSQMQNLNAKTLEQQEALHELRQWHHDVHLCFVKAIYLHQLDNGRHAHLEQPAFALSWKTQALRLLPGWWSMFDQCMYGCMCLHTDGRWLPTRKTTVVLTSKKAVYEALGRRCDGLHEHCALEGTAPGLGRRTRFMEDYQPHLSSIIAGALLIDEPPQLWEHALAVGERRQFTGELIKLRSEHAQEAVRVVQRLHRNLGHPTTTEQLLLILESRGASHQVIQAARDFKCVSCQRYRKPNTAAPSSIPTAKDFNQQVQADILWIKDKEVKYPILSMVDVGTKFQAACLVRGESAEFLIGALEKCWIRHFGAPRQLHTDEGRGWLGEQFQNWTTDRMIEHLVAPGEAHERLGLVERRHSILRKAVEVYLHDLELSGPDGIKESLVYVVPQINNTANVAGFSPSQWFLGYQPHVPGDLLSDDLGPQHLDGNSSFEDSLSRRNAAKAALLDVDLDMKLRRALLRKYEGDNAVLQTGQLCHFWRDARATDLVKIRWHGPAKVMIREDGPDGRPAVYWLAFKTQLIRCAPHHVRPDFTNASQTLLGNLQEAKRHLRDLNSRGVTRYLDLNVSNRRNLDDIEDDEQEEAPMDFDGDIPPDDPDDPQEPPRQRRRLLPFPHLDSEETQMDFEDEPSIAPNLDLEDELSIAPTSPAVPEDILDSPIEPGDPMLADAHLDLASVPASAPPQDSVPEPGIPTEPTTSTPPGQLALDPALAELYAPAEPGEDFLRARRRVDQQETLSFRPVRQIPHARPDPYARPDLPSGDRPGGHPEESDDGLFGQVFTVEDVDPSQLPDGWTIHSDGCFYLTNVPRDFWEVRAGCLLRHHVIPRRQLFRITDAGDAPFPESELDFVRSTLVQHPNGGQQILNDDGVSNGCPTQSRWTGITVFQIKGSTRKELGMAAYSNPRQVTKDQKVKNVRNVKKDKDKNGVSERHLDLQQRELFQAAKVKELKSFFENGVWEFQTTKEADPARTLSSRMLLKWAKNPDGSPRAKARLIVRGYSDIDALEGRVQTDSPTTSRLSRSLLLSISALCRWNGWTADVATAFLQGLPQERQLWVRLPSDALTILGASSECRMLLKKPCYGQLDAPRRWFLEATRRPKQLGLRQHCMDPCLFMLYESDFPEEPATPKEMVVGEDRLCGLICIHVDDLLGTGCPSSVTYQKLEARLKEAFNFREWHNTEAMEYCGASLVHNSDGWKLNHENYYKKLKPITVDKNRGTTDFLDSKDITQLRGLLGSLQWPAVQSSPHLQASASLLAGQLSTGNVETINEANRLLRFAKSNADVSLEYGAICPLEDLRLVCSFDAAFGVRRDGASQGGYITMLVPKGVFSGEEHPYHVVDWRSAKLPRIARSSLSAEAQAAGQAVDAVDHLCVFWSHILDPGKTLAELMHQPSSLEPTMVTDAKALYDSYQREALGNNLTDKRTGLEIRVMKERLEGLGGRLRWMSSERQFADGLTKFGTRQLLADRLRYGKVKYTWDPDYVASKRKGFEERQQSRQEFAQPSRARKDKQDEMDEEKNSAPDADDMAACAFELFMIDDGEAIEYKDVSGLAVSLLQNDLVHVDVMALDETDASADGETTIMKYNKLGGWKVFAAIFAVLVTPVETFTFAGQADQCLKTDEPEEFLDFWDFVVIGAVILTSWIIIGCLCLWIGFHRGRKHILQLRHVRSERLGRLHAEKQRQLVLQEEENRRVQQALHISEVTVAELLSLRELGIGMARRALREVSDHVATCPRNCEICIAPVAGRVWHAHRQCSHLSNAIRIEELPPCTSCADGPPINTVNGHGVSLTDELHEWLRLALL